MSANPPRPLAASALILFLCVSGAYAQARIDSVEGKVEVAPGGINLWIAVSTPPYVLKNGDRVRTAEKAKAKISFPDKSRVELGADARFGVEKVAKGEAALKLDAGVLDAFVAKGLSKHFRVTTPTAVATAHGTEFRVDVSPTKDTQVEVNDGVVGVKLKNGEETELGADRPFRSLLVLSGRPMAMLPHPNEDAGGRKSDASAVDCLHSANGALRKSVEAIEACQNQAHKKAGPLSTSDEAALREHNRQEIARFLNTTGIMDGPAPAADDGSDASDA
ncbi:MAG: FecR domain-containing protein, partial [Elusimicrobiota bacterium]